MYVCVRIIFRADGLCRMWKVDHCWSCVYSRPPDAFFGLSPPGLLMWGSAITLLQRVSSCCTISVLCVVFLIAVPPLLTITMTTVTIMNTIVVTLLTMTITICIGSTSSKTSTSTIAISIVISRIILDIITMITVVAGVVIFFTSLCGLGVVVFAVHSAPPAPAPPPRPPDTYSLTRTHPTLTRTHSLTQAHSLTHTHSLTRTHSPPHSLSLTLTRSLALTRRRTLSHSLSLARAPSCTHSHSLARCLSRGSFATFASSAREPWQGRTLEGSGGWSACVWCHGSGVEESPLSASSARKL